MKRLIGDGYPREQIRMEKNTKSNNNNNIINDNTISLNHCNSLLLVVLNRTGRWNSSPLKIMIIIGQLTNVDKAKKKDNKALGGN